MLRNKSESPDNLLKNAHPNTTTGHPTDLLEIELKNLYFKQASDIVHMHIFKV